MSRIIVQIKKRYLLQETRNVGQSLVVWAIKEGRAVAKSVDQYLKQKVLA